VYEASLSPLQDSAMFLCHVSPRLTPWATVIPRLTALKDILGVKDISCARDILA